MRRALLADPGQTCTERNEFDSHQWLQFHESEGGCAVCHWTPPRRCSRPDARRSRDLPPPCGAELDNIHCRSVGKIQRRIVICRALPRKEAPSWYARSDSLPGRHEIDTSTNVPAAIRRPPRERSDPTQEARERNRAERRDPSARPEQFPIQQE